MPKENVIFGTHSSQALRLLSYRESRRGLQHGSRLTPRDPRPGEPVTLSVWVGPEMEVREMWCYYTTDGSEPDLTSPRLVLNCTATEWDALLWGYRQRWEVDLPAVVEGTAVRYQIVAHLMDGRRVFADWPPSEEIILTETRRHFGEEVDPPILPPPDETRTFAYRVDTFAPPTWAREAVIYHIFVDRFAVGEGRAFTESDDLMDRFGGTLRGVIERLDYVTALGANTIWLSPIFPSPTHHGYDVTDYRAVEPRLGTLDDVRELLSEAARRDIRVLLDLPLNHASNEHPFFKEALHDPKSPYVDWFHFDPAVPNGYRAYAGVTTMPEWNLTNPEVRDYLTESALFWLRLGVSGFRLDYADGPGPAFWPDFRAACRAVRPDTWIFGEIVQPPNVLAPYEGRLDGSLDFLWQQMVRRAVAHGLLTAADLARFLDAHRATRSTNFVQPVFFDNHDIDRFLLAAGGDLRRLRMALLLLLTWPQPPIVFYGTEIGLRQPRSSREPGMGLEASRVPMLWEPHRQEGTLLADVRRLITLRRSHPDLVGGVHRSLRMDESVWIFDRSGKERTYVVALNLGEDARDITLPAGEVLWSTGASVRTRGKGHLDALGAIILQTVA